MRPAWPRPAPLGFGSAALLCTTVESVTIAVCPGSYDPVTLGHIDVIRRSTLLFERVIVVVAQNSAKVPLLTPQRRVELLRKALGDLCTPAEVRRIEVEAYDGLVATLCEQRGAEVIVKVLRQGGDYESELGMALMNRHLAGVETVFLPADPTHAHIASSYVKDVAAHGGDIADMVPPGVAEALAEAFGITAIEHTTEAEEGHRG